VNVNIIHTADMFGNNTESVVNALRSLYFKMPANSHCQICFLRINFKSRVINKRFLTCKITSEVSPGFSDFIVFGKTIGSPPFFQCRGNFEVRL
jgi:hypothetical protein